jgi:hypothetical protein
MFFDGECVDPYSGNIVKDCTAEKMVAAEDYTCVAPLYWSED